MGDHYRPLPTDESDYRFNMHSDGFIAPAKELVVNSMETVEKYLPEAGGGALGAVGAILAAPALVAGSIAVSEMALIGLAGYFIGKGIYKKVTHWATSVARDSVSESLNGDIN